MVSLNKLKKTIKKATKGAKSVASKVSKVTPKNKFSSKKKGIFGSGKGRKKTARQMLKRAFEKKARYFIQTGNLMRAKKMLARKRTV